MNRKTILLTGATGFLGSRLLAALVRAGHEVVILKRSFSDLSRLADAGPYTAWDVDRHGPERPFREHALDCIVHTATAYGRRGQPLEEVIQANLLFPLRLLALAVEHKVGAFVDTGTLLPRNLTPYTLSKAQFGDWLDLYAPPLRAVTLRVEHMYGPGDDANKFVPWLLERFDGHGPVPLTSGVQKRDFVHVDDVAAAFAAVLDALDGLGQRAVFEVGSGRSAPVRSLVEALYAEYSGQAGRAPDVELRFGAIPYRANEPMAVMADISGLAALGWTPRVPLDRGLAETVRLHLASRSAGPGPRPRAGA